MAGYRTFNPATKQLVREFPQMSSENIEEAVIQAVDAYSVWRKESVQSRAEFVLSIAEQYEEMTERLARDMAIEMGKPLAQGRGEIAKVIDIYRYYARNSESFIRSVEIEPGKVGGRAMMRKDPIGPILGIMPWNFPHYQVARFVAPNIMLGNTVLIKHSSICGQSAVNIQEIMAQAGLSRGIYQNLFASHQHVENLIADDRIRGVSLTGSESVGQRIGALAGEYVKPCVLELGGSDPMIILNDADLDISVEYAVQGRLSNAGQQCTGSKRFIVEAGIYDKFLEKFTDQMAGVAPNNPIEDDTIMGPMSSESAFLDIQAQVDIAIEDGAICLTGGTPTLEAGFYFPPTILTNVDSSNRAYYQEFFGPVAMVHRVENFEEAIRVANDSPYGLSASIFTEDEELADRAGIELEAGMICVNDICRSTPELPFGGVKRSGIGRELGPVGIEQFANLKVVRSV